MDGGAWWAAVCGVAQSQTRLKRLSSSSSKSSLYILYLRPLQVYVLGEKKKSPPSLSRVYFW